MPPMSGPTRCSVSQRWVFVVALGWVGVLLLTGCAADRFVELRTEPKNPLADTLSLYARGGPKPSKRTVLVLRRYALPSDGGPDISATITALSKYHETEPSAETAYALAELSYVAAARAELLHPDQAADFYMNAVAFAYGYLFDPRLTDGRNPYDPQFRGASVVYNTALEKCLRIAQSRGRFTPGTQYTFENCGRTIDVSIEPRGFNWHADDFESFQFVSDYNLKGLVNHHRQNGLGVPLIAIRRTGVQRPEMEQYYAKGFSFPVTAFLRLEPQETADGKPRLSATVELYDPLEIQQVRVANRAVPIESDISTPLAYFLDNPTMHQVETFGLLRPEKLRKVAGLYMVQPYQPGKIPVLMVHGLWSSPMTWMEALNDLRSDPVLRENYQFWFYLYPTAEPFWKSAADLREDLAEVRQTFGNRDPHNQLNEMVVVGHSMGGLISRLITYDSQDNYWAAVSNTPLAQVSASDDVKRDLQRIYYFEGDSAVRRVVTIASPHRGSEYANSFTKWLAKRLIAIPQFTLQTTQELLTLNPKAFRHHGPLGGSTSIDSLSPDSPILQVMHSTTRPQSVTYHNVVGVKYDDRPLEQNTDGVVAFGSAHREDVASEIVVQAEHSMVHRHPRTILELRRILRKHLTETANRRSPIQLLDHKEVAPPSTTVAPLDIGNATPAPRQPEPQRREPSRVVYQQSPRQPNLERMIPPPKLAVVPQTARPIESSMHSWSSTENSEPARLSIGTGSSNDGVWSSRATTSPRQPAQNVNRQPTPTEWPTIVPGVREPQPTVMSSPTAQTSGVIVPVITPGQPSQVPPSGRVNTTRSEQWQPLEAPQFPSGPDLP